MKIRFIAGMALMSLCLAQGCAIDRGGAKAGPAAGSAAAAAIRKPRTDLTGPRFTDNGNGTVTDNATGLIWLKNANCADAAGGIDKEGGRLTWAAAQAWTSGLSSGTCGLSDGSMPGQWRIPRDLEMKYLTSLKDYDNAALMNTLGFDNVQEACYWSYNTNALVKGSAHFPFDWFVFMLPSFKDNCSSPGTNYVWPVFSGQ